MSANGTTKTMRNCAHDVEMAPGAVEAVRDMAAAVTAAAAVSSRYGIVRRCEAIEPVAGLPPVSIFVAHGPERSPLNHDGAPTQPWSPVRGTGVGLDPAAARISAIAEAVERYCVSLPPWRDTTRAAHRDCADLALSPHRFAMFSTGQYADAPHLEPPSCEAEIDWSWAHSLTQRANRLVPAVAVYSSLGNKPPNNFLCGLTSTGVATHVAFAPAALAGLLEVVERDALMLHWHNGHPLPAVHIDPSDVPETLAALLDRLARVKDITFSFVDLTLDIALPTIGCIALADGDHWPAAVFGCATRLSAPAAACKAGLEALQMLHGLARRNWRQQIPLSPNQVRTLRQHALFYASPAGRDRLRARVDWQPRRNLTDLPAINATDSREALQICVDRVADAGLEVLVADLSTPDVAACGFTTLRVIAPGTADINGDVRYPKLGASRIRKVSRRYRWTHPPSAAPLPCPLA